MLEFLAVARVQPPCCMIEATISVGDSENMVLLLGTKDQHLKQIRNAFPAKISARDGNVIVQGEESDVLHATAVLEQLRTRLDKTGTLNPEFVSSVIQQVRLGNGAPTEEPVGVTGGRSIHPRSQGQAEYIKAIRNHSLVFCTGPAGTGKTYLAVATAIEALRNQQIRRIVLVRPAVEAGESLGFLPGDLQAKINPYLRPLFDALHDMMDYEQIQRYMEEDIIEVIPLAYMRGRTLNRAFIIMDEAQNTTVSQMKMFLTRMGEESQVVVSGDTSQTDLPTHTQSGLIDALTRLKNIDGFAHIRLTGNDIVRHRIVRDIVAAYDGKSKKR